MGNIDINTIWKRKEIVPGTLEARIEEYCRSTASTYTDRLLEVYKRLPESRNGRYINSDLMKMVYPFYAKKFENRQKFNLCITNSAAVLTNEAYKRAIKSDDVKRCIFVVGPYGAGKSFFVQSLFENDDVGLLEDSIVYEGSITPPAFEQKIIMAKEKGVIPDIIALNPTFELSMRNIRERAKKIGRDVIKDEVLAKFSGFYQYLTDILNKYPDITYIIYNKESNIPIDLSSGSQDLTNFNCMTEEELSAEYDRIKAKIDEEERISRLSKKHEVVRVIPLPTGVTSFEASTGTDESAHKIIIPPGSGSTGDGLPVSAMPEGTIPGGAVSASMVPGDSTPESTYLGETPNGSSTPTSRLPGVGTPTPDER